MVISRLACGIYVSTSLAVDMTDVCVCERGAGGGAGGTAAAVMTSVAGIILEAVLEPPATRPLSLTHSCGWRMARVSHHEDLVPPAVQ